MITLLLTIAIIGFIVYLITTYIPMPPIFINVIYVITAIVIILYVWRAFGGADVPLPGAAGIR